ncbi:hypothetical protein Tco_1536247, partial [Tanacetum coccineum]
MESNPSQNSVCIPMVTEMHKEDQQVIGGPNSLGVTSEERADPQLSSRYGASANSTAEADPGKSVPSDFIPQQQDMNEGTKNTSYDHLFAGTDPHVLTDQTQSVSKGLETVLNQSTSDKVASNIDLDSPEDDLIIVVDDSDEDEEAYKDGLYATLNIETEDASVPKSSSP